MVLIVKNRAWVTGVGDRMDKLIARSVNNGSVWKEQAVDGDKVSIRFDYGCGYICV